MIKLYLKQSWELVKQNKLFSSIYVAGTGLAIALVMVMFIIFYVKFAPVYPEYNRNRTLVVKYVKSVAKENGNNFWAGQVSPTLAQMIDSLPHLEHLAIVSDERFNKYQLGVPGSNIMLPVSMMMVNDDFWRVFTFRFLSGKPFTAEEVEASARVAVITESTARRLFADADVVGRKVLYKGQEMTVCGVVKDASSATPASAADVWLPLPYGEYVSYDEIKMGILRGNLQLYLTAATAADKKLLKAEVQEAVHKFNSTVEIVNDLMEQPDDYWFSTFRVDTMNAPQIGSILRTFGFILLALLFIPAINLGGMISSRMDQRISELGIRRAYGANRRTLISQVLWENLLLTVMGGLFGLLCSYVIVLTCSSWILTLFDTSVDTYLPMPFLSFEMLFNPWVFLSTFALCLVLNLASALIPATWALRRTIIQSLNTKR